MWIAIDAGTSVIKSVLFADDGRELALAREGTRILKPSPEASEQDMDEVWAAVVATVHSVLASAASDAATGGEPLRGLVSTAQGDGCWPVDAHGRPTGKAILWNDGRGAAMVERWRELGVIEASFRYSASATYPGLANAILAWLAEHEPARPATRWALTCNGWIFAQLTGRFAADLSDASNPFSDVARGAYAPEALELYGLGQQSACLPPVLAGRDCMGALQTRAAEELGLTEGLPVVLAPYDIVCTAYGAGATRPGQACAILGTTICAEVITPTLDREGSARGTTLALDGDLYLRAMPTLTGCEALEWMARMLGIEGIPALDDLVAASAAASDAPFFLPYLSPAGERSPFLAPEASGSFHALTLLCDRATMARAVYEGLSFAVRECLEAATREPVSDLRVCGGGARSDFWCRMIADVLGMPVIRVEGSEQGARGAFLFALYASGTTASIAEGADRHVREAATYLPSEAAHQRYSERYKVFRELRDMARPQWTRMERLR